VSLERFGFTPTENRVYAALLKLGATTGYAVAREMGVARANVYQALEGLVRRGAARKSATLPSRYAAMPPASLVVELQRLFRRDLTDLEDSLRALPRGGNGHVATAGLEGVASAERLLERASACADSAQAELLAVVGPWAAGVSDAILRASRRGVSVRAVSLGEPALEGIALRAVAPEDLLGYWGGLPIAVAADRARAVAGIVLGGGAASGIVTEFAGVVPFIRHLLRRETSGAA